MWRTIKKVVDRKIEVALRGATDMLVDAKAMQHIAPLRTSSYTPWPSPAIRPSALTVILDETILNDRRRIVECGAGISTIYINKLLKSLGDNRSLITFEDNLEWSEKIRGICATEGLADAQIVHAPLAHCDLIQNGLQWYDRESVNRELKGRTIDLLFVDGPNSFRVGEGQARYPAVPAFVEYLDESWCIILDDIRRPGESAVMKKWSELLEVDADLRVGDVGIGILRSGRAWSV